MRKTIYCIIILFSNGFLNAQNSNRINAVADSLFAAGQYDACYDYAGRIMAINSEQKIQTDFMLVRAKCLLQKKQYVQAARMIRDMKTVNEEELTEKTIVLVLCYLQLKNPVYALSIFPDLPKDTLLKKRLIYYKTICYFRCDSLETGHQYAKQLLTGKQATVMDSFYHHIKLKYRKPGKASGLNAIPGLGFLYAKDYKNALNSFLLNGAVITLSIVEGKKAPLLGVYLFSQFGLRYYMGGIKKAGRSAVLRNNKQIQEYLDQWQSYIRQNQLLSSEGLH